MVELLSRDELNYLIVPAESDAGSVHPWLIFVNQSQSRPRILDQGIQYGVLEYDVGLEQQRIILQKPFLGQGQRIDVVGLVIYGVLNKFNRSLDIQRRDIIYKPTSLIADNNNDSFQIQPVLLFKHPLYKGLATNLDHALCIVMCQFLQSLSHSGSKNYRLHISFSFSLKDCLSFFNQVVDASDPGLSLIVPAFILQLFPSFG